MEETLINKIDNLEKTLFNIKDTLLSLNQELINQNIKLSEKLYGSNTSNFLFTPEPPNSNDNNNESKNNKELENNDNNENNKELFYENINNYIYIWIRNI